MLLAVAPFVQADGPHWHVPNPDPETPPDDDPNQDPKPPGPMELDSFNGSYHRCPGDFKKMDVTVLQYYMTHCMIGAQDRKKTYEQIVHRCAQALREVDTYSPCPDSFPLWKSEKNRERMIQYAQRTWLLVAEMEPAVSDPCVKLCIDCYIDSVRFNDDSHNKVGRMKQVAEVQKRLSDTIMQMAFHKDPGARNSAQMQWINLGQQYTVMTRLLSGTYGTFISAFMTGDLPAVVDDCNSRMRETIAKMGFIAIPALEQHAKHTNKMVQKAVLGLIEQIKSQYRDPTYANVLALLKMLDRRGGSRDGQLAVEQIKIMGKAAWPHLVAIADKEGATMALWAFKTLNQLSGRSFGNNLKEWQEYVASVTPKPAAEVADAEDAEDDADDGNGKKPRKKMARTAVPLNSKDKHRDLKEDTTPDIVIKRRPGYVEQIDDE